MPSWKPGPSGKNSLQTLSLTTNGTLWEGWGAGPLTAPSASRCARTRWTTRVRRATTTCAPTCQLPGRMPSAARPRVTEGFTELNLPLVSGVPGVNLWSLNGAVRYSSYNNKGGAGTTGEISPRHRHVINWKFPTVFEPFDWMRLRLTRSRDLRAAGYRDLFLYPAGHPGFADRQ